MPVSARLVILLLFLALAVTFVWQGVQYLLHSSRKAVAVQAAPAAAPAPAMPSQAVAWQNDTFTSIESAARDAQAGNLTASEVDLDRASSILEASRVESHTAATDFFVTVVNELDRVASAHPENDRLIEHTRIVRIDLAELRSSLEGSPPDSSAPSGSTQATASVAERRATLGAPRSVAAATDVTPAVFGADYVDATLMPDTAEILEPPSTRLFTDNVRVENLTFAGAAQTLDGIHWHNVTFIGTRLRYEGGEVDLQNVHFLHCTFGFTTDDRGARLANAIALGQSSIVIE